MHRRVLDYLILLAERRPRPASWNRAPGRTDLVAIDSGSIEPETGSTRPLDASDPRVDHRRAVTQFHQHIQEPRPTSFRVTARGLDDLIRRAHLEASGAPLRLGWLFLNGTASIDGSTQSVFVPLAEAPVELEPIALRRDCARVTLLDEPRLPPDIDDEDLQARLESVFWRFFSRRRPAPDRDFSLLSGATTLVGDITSELGFGRVAPIAGRGSLPAIHHRDLVVEVSCAVYLAGDDGGHRVSTLRGWRQDDLLHTAWRALFETIVHPQADHSTDIDVPFPLNDAQRRAVIRAQHSPISTVSGPPGTGKTHLAAAIAVDTVVSGGSVLIATASDAAADAVTEILDRYPTPQHIRFGRDRHRRVVAERIEESTEATNATVETAQSLDGRRERLNTLMEGVGASLDREARFAEDVKLRESVAGPTRGVDPERCRRLLDRAETGWRRLREPRRRRLARLLQTRTGTPFTELAELIEHAEREQRIARHLDAGGTRLDEEWDRIETAQHEVFGAIAATVDLQRSRTSRSHRRSAATLAAALRSGRAARRRLLDQASSEFVEILPLWVGTLSEVDDLLPQRAGMFDLVIVDEASQVELTTAVAALARARRAVVIGDPKQLRHVSFVADQDIVACAEQAGIAPDRAGLVDVRRMSLYDIAAAAEPAEFLGEHFRSAPHIIGFSDRTFYRGRLELMTRHPHTERSDRIDTIRVENGDEVATVLDLVESAGERAATIGVVSPFREHAEAIREAALERFDLSAIADLGLKVGTVHGFQGVERDEIVIALDLARRWPKTRSFIEDPNLFNVMVTRARHGVTLVLGVDESQLGSGLLSRYHTYGVTPPEIGLGTRPSPDPRTRRLVSLLTEYGLDCRTEYPVGRWTLDLVVSDATRALAVETRVHPDGPGAHIERRLDLRRAGWGVVDLFLSAHMADDEGAVDHVVTSLLGSPSHP